MKSVKKILILLWIICFGDVCSMHIPPKWIAPDRRAVFPFVLQHGSGLLDGVEQKVFGEFTGHLDRRSGLIGIDGKVWDKVTPIEFSKVTTITLEDIQSIAPLSLDNFIDTRMDFLSAEEVAFHRFLHDHRGSVFLAFIETLQIAGIRYYSSSNEFDEFLQRQVLSMKREMEKVRPTDGTLQKSCVGAIETLVAQAEGIQRIKNKTYCLAGIRLDYIDTDHGEEIKNRFFLLPYVFVSDGMDPGAIGMMEKSLVEAGKLPFGRINNVDYYSMDLHDTSSTVKRVLDTMSFVGYREHPICSSIIGEVSHPEHIELDEIRKFAHAEQRALDRLAIMLLDFITAIAKDPSVGSNVIVKGMRVHMLVNNDSCCRCDAVIKGATEKRGWLERLLIASMHTSETFLESPKRIVVDSDTGLMVTAVVSSVAPYNTGMDLNEMHFLSRGGIMREVMRKKSDSFERKEPAIDELSRKVPILKFYE